MVFLSLFDRIDSANVIIMIVFAMWESSNKQKTDIAVSASMSNHPFNYVYTYIHLSTTHCTTFVALYDPTYLQEGESGWVSESLRYFLAVSLSWMANAAVDDDEWLVVTLSENKSYPFYLPKSQFQTSTENVNWISIGFA